MHIILRIVADLTIGLTLPELRSLIEVLVLLIKYLTEILSAKRAVGAEGFGLVEFTGFDYGFGHFKTRNVRTVVVWCYYLQIRMILIF